MRSTLNDCPHLLNLTVAFCVGNKHACGAFHSIMQQKCAFKGGSLPHTDKTLNSTETGLNQFFITTLSAAVLPQMPFIMQILNGKRLIYQAWCKNHSAGNIINNALSKTFQL